MAARPPVLRCRPRVELRLLSPLPCPTVPPLQTSHSPSGAPPPPRPHTPTPPPPPLPPPPPGFHRAFERWAKPFNPILGETWQASLPDGSRIRWGWQRAEACPSAAACGTLGCRHLRSTPPPFSCPLRDAHSLEQISHHPPISAFQMQGPHGLYTFTGMRCAGRQGRAGRKGRRRQGLCTNAWLRLLGLRPPALWSRRGRACCARGCCLPAGAHHPWLAALACPPCSQPSVSYKTNAVKTTARGYRVLDFKDGGRVEVHFPAYHLRGEGAGWGGGSNDAGVGGRACS